MRNRLSNQWDFSYFCSVEAKPYTIYIEFETQNNYLCLR